MSLSHEQIEQYLVKISSGIEYQYVGDTLLIFKFPEDKVLQKAKLIYDRAYDKAVADGMLPVSELEELIEKRNLISQEELNKLKRLKNQLEAQEILLGKTTRVKANQDRIKGVIDKLRLEIRSIEYKKQSKLLMSAENKADEEKAFYMCSQCTYDEHDRLLWASYEASLKESRLDLRDKILYAFIRFYSGLPVRTIREIARSGLWRVRYISSVKTSDPLFGVPASKYTTDQLNLSYWSNYYQNIYEMMPEDRPNDATIEDDDALDAFMKAFYEERNRQEAERRHTNKRSGKLSAFDSEEVIVTRSHELYEDIDYDTPREAQKIKDRADLKKRTKRG